ncbi:MAG: PEGA domain-containing protein [Candidatus Andersenbacteria bacterium]|nr:PEGA domain-containing protein [bacterium]MDZ4225338.1 PEGA domain-containing protein [Candidatus Andersenbacteria bacterium]
MQKIYRRALLFITLVIFIALTPLVVLYAIGYRATLKNIDPLPIGVALVKSKPSRASIYINDKPAGKTPKTLPNLIAGNVNISLALREYRSWSKNIAIKPGMAADLSDIVLFPANIDSHPLAQDAVLFSLSPNRKLIAYISSNLHLSVIDQDSHPIVDSQALTTIPQTVLWSPNSASLLLHNKNNYWLVNNFGASSPILLSTLNGAADAIWDPVVPNRLLFTDVAGSLKAYNASTGALQIIAKQVNIFATSNKYIYTVSEDNIINVFNLSGGPQNINIPSPDKKIVKLLITPSGNIAYTTKDTGVWYLNESNQPVLISSSSAYAGWSPDGAILFIATDPYTINVFSTTDEISFLPKQILQFITRLSRPITAIQWFAGSRHLIYQIDDEIIISEIDVRDHPISEQITTTNNGNAQTAVGTDGEMIYYLKKTTNKTGLYQSDLVIQQ